MYNVTHKLVEEVLKIRIHKRELLVFEDRIDFVYCTLKESEPRNKIMNIHEFAHRCKTWAHSNGYWLSIRLYEPNGFNIVVFSHIHSQLQKDLKEINDKTEPEAVFRACEWILEKMKENHDK